MTSGPGATSLAGPEALVAEPGLTRLPHGRAREPDLRAGLGRSMIVPLLLWLAVTIALPLAYCVWISVTNANSMGGTPRFVGHAITSRSQRREGLLPALRSLVWAIAGSVLQTAIAAMAALILNERFRGRHIARTWILASWVVPTIVTTFLWRWMLNADHGVDQPRAPGRTSHRRADRFSRLAGLRLCDCDLDQRLALVSLPHAADPGRTDPHPARIL